MDSTGLVFDHTKSNAQEDGLQEAVVENRSAKHHFQWPEWAYALLKIIESPDKPEHSRAILYRDDDVIIISDKFPKAKFHYLVLPVTCRIDTAADVTRSDIPVLEKMLDRASKFLDGIKSSNEEAAKSNFKMGFHGKPSMKQLHLHVISDDFNSSSMKHAKHYNSFTTRYFIEAHEFIERVRQEGYYPINFAEFAKIAEGHMTCHKCGILMGRNWDKAKKHYTACTGPNPENNNRV